MASDLHMSCMAYSTQNCNTYNKTIFEINSKKRVGHDFTAECMPRTPSEGLKITGSGVTEKYLDLDGKQLSCDSDIDTMLGQFPSSVSYFSFSI